MDRLSSYAAREAESESPADRKQAEEAALIRLTTNLQLLDETKSETAPNKGRDKQTNGEQLKADDVLEVPENNAKQPASQPSESLLDTADGVNETAPLKKNRGIPNNVKLYEIFYGQVTNLVNAQRLHIQDTIALLVSLTNLAL